MKLKVKIEVWNDGQHIQQILVGYRWLKAVGVIDEIHFINHNICDNRLLEEQNLAIPTLTSGVRITINKLYILIYDIHDSGSIHTDILDDVTLYFKRSYQKKVHSRISSKIRPLGLNHYIAPNNWEIDQYQRIAMYYKGLSLGRELLHYLLQLSFPQTNNFGNWPDYETELKILFMARLWSPEQINDDLPFEKVDEINKNRIECIRIMKSNFGSKYFFGGLQEDSYSLKHAPDIILPKSITARRNYFNLVCKHSICISTTGLLGSIGWKFSEYVGLSRAILSEPLIYEVPGDFGINKNYIEFNSTDECVEKANFLLNNKDAVQSMMIENYRYYHMYQRPDSIILNSLIQLLEVL